MGAMRASLRERAGRRPSPGWSQLRNRRVLCHVADQGFRPGRTPAGAKPG